jgi:hypothetical protein
MTSAAYYRQEAEQARASAENSKDPETILRWLRIAKYYKALADVIAADEAKLSAVSDAGARISRPGARRTG